MNSPNVIATLHQLRSQQGSNPVMNEALTFAIRTMLVNLSVDDTLELLDTVSNSPELGKNTGDIRSLEIRLVTYGEDSAESYSYYSGCPHPQAFGIYRNMWEEVDNRVLGYHVEDFPFYINALKFATELAKDLNVPLNDYTGIYGKDKQE